ncbi:DUF3566 domain-containing protein [Rhodococcoides fascians]|uniref:DUF3566 domain-containing protein n=1 Tax=Rhodococcoides fascians TaxID=1828 RepID=UPI0009B8AF1D|nr:DUF3566 domain-containing protein [Rhodococcus fascians]
MSTPNRPGSRPGPTGGPDSRDAAQTEQPSRPAPPEGARPGSRPQPATRPAPAAGRGPAPQQGSRPPARPTQGGPAGPPRPTQGPPPQRPPAPQGQPGSQGQPAPQGPPPRAPQQGPAPQGPAQSRPPQAANGRPGEPGTANADGGRPANGQPPQGQGPSGPASPPRPANDAAPVAEGSAESKAPAPTQAIPTQRGDGPQGGSGTPPWQRGPGQRPAQQGPDDRQQPQNQPQTNLSGRGTALPATGEFDRSTAAAAAASAAPGQRESGQRESSERESGEDKTERREAARSKAAVIDGPTRHIERKDLAKDMPDLSATRHPEPTAADRAAPTAITAVPSADGDPLRATIQIRKIDPWSTLKIALVIAVSLFFVWMVAVGLLYAVLDGMGVWDRLNSAFTEIVNESGDGGLVSAGQVFGYAAVIGVINVVLFTALTTIGAFIYNLSSDLVGGVEVTLADRD